MLFDGPGGYNIDDDWWKKTPSLFRDQVLRYCPLCGASLPVKGIDIHQIRDFVTPENYKRLLEVNSPKAKKGDVKIINSLSEVFGVSSEDDYLEGGGRAQVTQSMKNDCE